MPPAGSLRRPLKLQSKTPSTDAEGNAIEALTTVATVAGRVRPLSTREFFLAAQAGVTATFLVTTHYRTDITHNHRFLDGPRVLDIQTVTPDEAHTELNILCEEITQA